MSRRLVGVVLLAAAVFAALAWPRLDDVETGRTPQYPELQPHGYAATEAAVTKAVQSVLAQLPGWRFGGAGAGPTGSEVQAVYTSWLRLEYDVTVRIRREGGRTRVSLRSKSRIGPWDFGQNARNILLLQAEIDRAVR